MPGTSMVSGGIWGTNCVSYMRIVSVPSVSPARLKRLPS